MIACFVAVYGAELGRGTYADSEPLLTIRPPRGDLTLHDPERLAGAEEGAGQVRVDDVRPLLDGELLERDGRSADAGVVEEQVEAAEAGLHLGEGPLDGGRAADVALERDRAAAELGRRGFERGTVRPARTTVKPASASAAETDRPIPLPAPVTSAIFGAGRSMKEESTAGR